MRTVSNITGSRIANRGGIRGLMVSYENVQQGDGPADFTLFIHQYEIPRLIAVLAEGLSGLLDHPGHDVLGQGRGPVGGPPAE